MPTDQPTVRRRTTGSDVARLAGVSRATVSYVLNDVPHQKIPEKTRRRVLEAAQLLNYRISPEAKALRRGRSDIVLGLVEDTPMGEARRVLLSAMSRSLAASGFVFTVHPYNPDVLPLREVCKVLTPACVFSLVRLLDEDVAELASAGIPLSKGGQDPATGEPSSSPFARLDIAAHQVRFLAGIGHRTVGLAVPREPDSDPLLALYAASFARNARRSGISAAGVRTVAVDGDNRELLARWMAADPAMTAIAAFGDGTALAVLRAAHDDGVRVPEDLALIGAFDALRGRLSRPALTTVAVDVVGTAGALAALLVGSVADASTPPVVTEVEPPHVIPRASTGAGPRVPLDA